MCDFRELEVASREVHSLLQRVHRLSSTLPDHYKCKYVSRPGGVLEANKLAGQAKDKFSKVQELYKVLLKIRLCWTNVGTQTFQVLDTQLPAGSFWKYSQLWGSTTSWISFLASLTIYLETETLATKEQV